MRKLIAVLCVLVGCLAVPALASAHNVTKATIECVPGGNGATQVDVQYENFTPVGNPAKREAITADYTNGSVDSATPTQNQSPPDLIIPGPKVPNGTKLGATLKWAEGTYTVAPVTLMCQPVPPPPPPPNCVPPTVLQNGHCVPPTPPPTPPAPTPPAPTPPAPTPPAPTPPAPVPPAPTPPPTIPRCVRVSTEHVQVSLTPTAPQFSSLEYVTLRATSKNAKEITVTVTGNDHRWVFHHRGPRLVLRLRLGNVKVWGINPDVPGSPYGLHDIRVGFKNTCSSVHRTLKYFNWN